MERDEKCERKRNEKLFEYLNMGKMEIGMHTSFSGGRNVKNMEADILEIRLVRKCIFAFPPASPVSP